VPLTNRIPAVWLVVTGIASVQIGAAIANDLFDLVPPRAMVWLRLVTSAVILLLMARPRLAGHSGRDWLIVLGFGVSLMTMNWAIYQSFAWIPLGIAVTIEFSVR
jgi:inner membrane transporter RhtA